MTEYFDKRALSYLQALDDYPHAMSNEYTTAVDMCSLEENHVLVTIPSSCERIQSYLPQSVTLIQFETTKTLSDITGISFCQWGSIPLPSASVDRILCMASLHHCNDEERLQFYRECFRILRAGGKLIVADVEKDSNLSYWLNTFVDKYNPYGHNGVFFSKEDVSLFEIVGFQVKTAHTEYPWIFNTKDDMIKFTQMLFMLNADNDTIYQGIQKYLSPTENSYSMGILYFICSKP
jgi:predicted SAM-dependent methyltransferase